MTDERHPTCPGGCGELADECACPNPRPLGSIRTERMVGGLPESWWADEQEAAE